MVGFAIAIVSPGDRSVAPISAYKTLTLRHSETGFLYRTLQRLTIHPKETGSLAQNLCQNRNTITRGQA
jgi:hypothetical protein